MSKKTVYTCYGCPYYFTPKGYKDFPHKHCGKDHTKCDYYWGKADNIGKTIDEVELDLLEWYGQTRKELMAE